MTVRIIQVSNCYCGLFKGDWESAIPRWYHEFWMYVDKMLDKLFWACQDRYAWHKCWKDIATGIYLMGKRQDSTGVKWPLQEFQALHVVAAAWIDKIHHLFACYNFLENKLSLFGISTNHDFESTYKSINLRVIWLNLTYEITNINSHSICLLGKLNGFYLQKCIQILHGGNTLSP